MLKGQHGMGAALKVAAFRADECINSGYWAPLARVASETGKPT
jgi:hypothetical protein